MLYSSLQAQNELGTPLVAALAHWHLLYSSGRDGLALSRFESRTAHYSSPVLVLVQFALAAPDADREPRLAAIAFDCPLECASGMPLLRALLMYFIRVFITNVLCVQELNGPNWRL